MSDTSEIPIDEQEDPDREGQEPFPDPEQVPSTVTD